LAAQIKKEFKSFKKKSDALEKKMKGNLDSDKDIAKLKEALGADGLKKYKLKLKEVEKLNKKLKAADLLMKGYDLVDMANNANGDPTVMLNYMVDSLELASALFKVSPVISQYVDFLKDSIKAMGGAISSIKAIYGIKADLAWTRTSKGLSKNSLWSFFNKVKRGKITSPCSSFILEGYGDTQIVDIVNKLRSKK